jgi:glycosyl-4,4'-diaponeurosporenoate acyltransferase
MFIYALAVNLPCMIAQRYNRPRFLKILRRSTRSNCSKA